MTKSFLVFPTGSAGGALLLLRLALAAALGASLVSSGTIWSIPIAGLLILGLVAGIFTRVVAACCALAALVVGVRLGGPLGFSALLHGLCAVALSMLGGGGYSVDARLFGRRIIELDR